MRSKLGILAVLATLFTTVFAGSASAREHGREWNRMSGYSRYLEHDRAARREREFRLERMRERELAARRCW